MAGKNYNTLNWIGGLAMVTMLMAWWAQQTQESWTFYIVVASFAVLLIGIVWRGGQWLRAKAILRKIDVLFLVPKKNYPYKTFAGAPDKEKLVKKLTVGIGSYHVLLKVTTRKDVFLYPIGLLVEDDTDNKPIHNGKDNGFIFERLPDGQFRDWVGDVTIPPKEYPRPLRPKQSLIDCNIVKTTNNWAGKFHIQIQTMETIVDRYLDFVVSETQDDIPFLKIENNIVYIPISINPTPSSFGEYHPASTTQIGRDVK